MIWRVPSTLGLGGGGWGGLWGGSAGGGFVAAVEEGDDLSGHVDLGAGVEEVALADDGADLFDGDFGVCQIGEFEALLGEDDVDAHLLGDFAGGGFDLLD